MTRVRRAFTACVLLAAVALVSTSCTCEEPAKQPVPGLPADGPGGNSSSIAARGAGNSGFASEDVEQVEADNEKLRELNGEGLELYRDRKFAEAAIKFEKALALEPQNETLKKNTARSYYGLGISYSEKKENRKALETLGRALEILPEDLTVQLMIAVVLFREKRYDEARAFCETILERADENSEISGSAQKLLGEILLATGDRHGALREWGLYFEEHKDGELAARYTKLKREVQVEERLDERGTARFTLRFDGAENPQIGGAVLAMLEDAYTQVGGALSFYPEEPVTVILYPEKLFYHITGSYGWVSALYDGKIKIPVKDFEKHKSKIARTVRHEYTHALIFRIAPECPAWLHEGIAQYFEGVDLSAAEKALAPERPGIISFADMPSNFTRIRDMKRVARYYRQSYSFVAYLESAYGIVRIAALLEALPGKKLDAAFKHVYNRSLAGLEKDWKESLR